MRRTFASIAGAALALAALIGCGASPTGGTMDPRDTVLQRASFEDSEQTQLDMLKAVRSALAKAFPEVDWSTTEPVTLPFAGCGEEFADVAGGRTGGWSTGGGGAIPAADWSRAVEVAFEAAKPFGYERAAVISSEAGNLEASLYGKEGDELTFGSEKSTSLLVLGSCHLPAAARASTS